VFGAAWHHDGAAKGPKPIGFAQLRVVAGAVVQLSFLARPVCLPVLARLWRPRHTGKIAHARELAELIAARYPDRMVLGVGTPAHGGPRLRTLDDRITWTSRLKLASVLHQLPPPRTRRSGRPRSRGARLGTPTDLAASATAGARWRHPGPSRKATRAIMLCGLRTVTARSAGGKGADQRPRRGSQHSQATSSAEPSPAKPRSCCTGPCLPADQAPTGVGGLISEYERAA
jgi:hypothetical protein